MCFSLAVSLELFGAEQRRFEPTAGVELSNGSRLRVTSLDSCGAKTVQVKSKSVIYEELKNVYGLYIILESSGNLS